ncbi:MAG: large repetitive protein [Pyrinomonadaceae bacterium]|nr:large repetitive protein [Pyrinomonadaceae bacterium]
MKSFTPKPGVSTSRAFLASLLTSLMLVSPLTPIGLASTNNTRLVQTRSKSAGQQQSPPQADTSAAQQKEPPVVAAIAATDITATKTDTVLNDTLGDGKAQAGDTIQYSITINNNSLTDTANAIVLNDTIDPNTSIVAGSLHAQPVARTDAYTTVSNTLLEVGVTASGFPAVTASGSVFDNDSQPNGAGGTDALQYVSNSTPANGTLTFNSNGTFSYLPNVGYVGADSFTYTVRNNGDNTLSDMGTVNITVGAANPAVAGSDIWYVDNSYGGANGASDGRSTRPFTSLSPVNGAGGAGDSDAAGDIIYLATGNAAYTTGLALENTEQFIGGGVALLVNTFTLKAAGGRPTLNNTGGNVITLASNNTVSGLNTGTTSASGAAILGSSFGTATINNLAIGSGAVRALDLSTGVLAIAIDSSTSSGAGTGINLSNTSGTLTVSGATSISNAVGINVAGAAFPTLNFNGGLAITSTAGAGIIAAGGNINIAGTTNTIGSTGGPALNLTNVNLGSGATFSTVTSSGSATNGIKFDNVSGPFTANGGSIATATGTDVDINAGAGNVTFAGSITNTAGRSVSITNRTGGNVTLSGNISDTGTGLLAQNNTSGTQILTFSGTTKTFNTGANAAITLDNNDNATITFSNGGLAITTTTGAGFNALNGATAINVTGTNTISSTGAVALSVVNSTIGASGLAFQSITSGNNDATADPVNGIVLNNTGANAGLTVSGTGSANSGGTIQRTNGDAISLINTRNISFDRMNIQSPLGSGVSGTQVTNFTFTNSTVDNPGDANEESCLAFNTSKTTANNIAGTLTITGNTLTNCFYSGVDVQSGDGTVTNANVSNNTITTTDNGQGINFVGVGTATTVFKLENATINQNNISGTRAAGIQVQVDSGSGAGMTGTAGVPGDATKLISITNNSIRIAPNSTQAIAVVTGSAFSSVRTKMNFKIECNGKNTGGCTAPTAVGLGYSSAPVTSGTIVLIGNNGYSDMVGVVNNNAIAANHSVDLGGGNGIGGGNGVSGAGAAWTPDLTLSVTNNTISGVDGNGILLVDRATNGFADLKITGNNVAAPIATTFRPGIRVDAGNGTAGENAHLCATISGNTSGGSAGSPGIGVRKQGTNAAVNVFGITGLSPNPATGPQVEDYLSTQNPGSVLGTSSDGFTNKRAINFSGAPFASCATAPPVADEDINVGSAKANGANTSRSAMRTAASLGMTIEQWQSFIDSDATPTFGLINGQIIPVAPNAPVANPAPPSDVTPASESSATETVTEAVSSAVAPATFYLGAPQTLAQATKVETAAQQPVVSAKQTTPEPITQATTPVIQPLAGGNNFPVSIGALAPGDSVTITFQVTVNSNIPNNVTQVSNQGQITSSSFGGTVLTNDPATGPANDPTVTPILPRPTYTINNASIPEPSTGSVNMPFTVSLSYAYGSPVSVDFATADGTATAAGGDYTPTSGTLNFAVGQTLQTISVPVLANGDTSDENFTVTLSNPVNSVLGATVTATGTITEASPPGRVLISEVRTSGPAGAGDDFVELYNNQDVAQNISGWALYKTGASCLATPVLIAVIPAATTIPARGHYLVVGPQYSLTTSAAGNATVAAVTDIEADRNIGLFNTSNVLNLSTTTREDAVAFDVNAGGGNNCDLLREGATLLSAGGSASQHSFARNLITGLPKETNDNAADFLLVTTTPAVAVGNNLTPVLGAPGPENLASPIQRNAVVKSSLIDPMVAASAPPNRVRSSFGANPTNAAFGTLSFQRRFKNTLGVPVTRLRFRIVDLTTINNRTAGQSDLRVLSSTGTVTNSAGGTVVVVNGLTLETPPQPNGGGLNSTLSVVLPGGGLAAGNTIDVQFLLGVQEQGAFSFFINVEALPGSGPIPDEATGTTKAGTTGKQRNADATPAGVDDAGQKQPKEQ